MKTTIIVCLIILVAWSCLALIQLWFVPLNGWTFIKISITAGVLDFVVLIVSLCRREYCENTKMKDDGYID